MIITTHNPHGPGEGFFPLVAFLLPLSGPWVFLRRDAMTIKQENLGTEPQIKMCGILSLQACVPEDWTDEQVLELAEKKNPCGTTNGWFIRKQGDSLLNGSDERVQCAGRKGFVHIMIDC